MEDAASAFDAMNAQDIPSLTGGKKMVIKFRPNKKALGKVPDGPAGADHTPKSASQTPLSSPLKSPPKSPAGSSTTWEAEPPASPEISSAASPQETPAPEQDQSTIPSNRIWLGNISASASVRSLRTVFSRFGNLTDAAVFPARIGPLGYAFVNFESVEDGVRAYEALNNEVVPLLTGTKQLKMRFKKPKVRLTTGFEGGPPGFLSG